MLVEIEFTSNPILPSSPDASAGEFGALTEFRGIVRAEEHGASIAGLHYEIYEAMAREQLESIIRMLGAAHPCHSVRLVHRFGPVKVGETAIYVAISGVHRDETFLLLSALMKRLKHEVTIWKTGTF